MTNSWIDQEELALCSSAEWRYQKAAAFPDDLRNKKAADLLRKLAVELRQIEEGPVATMFCAVQTFLFSEGAGTQEDKTEDVLNFWSLYRKGIGFHDFPADAEAYLKELIKFAEKESPAVCYITGRKKARGKV